MDNTFEKAFEDLLVNEGGYTDDPKDRGNWTSGVVGQGELKGTKYGISAMSYPNLDIKNLSIETAKAIYYRDFWAGCKLDLMEPVLAQQLFDSIIQHGKVRTIKLLQQTLGTTSDGIIGPQTVNLVRCSNQKELALKFISLRLSYYTQIKTFNLYGKAWVNRMATNLNNAIQLLSLN